MHIGTGIGNRRCICKLEDIQLLGGGADVIKRQGLHKAGSSILFKTFILRNYEL